MMKHAVLGNRFVLSALSLLLLIVILAPSARGTSFGTQVAHAAAPSITSTEVNQTPRGGEIVTVTLPTHVVYTATVTISTGQADALTIQLKGEPNIGTRTLSCANASNAGQPVVKLDGNPSCRWAGPINAGTFTFTFAGNLDGSIGGAVPDAASLVCSDINNNGNCSDELAESKIGLTDADGDVGPLTIAGTGIAPNVTTEVSQFPAGGGTVVIGGHITYVAVVQLNVDQIEPVTIQLKGDPNITNRTLSCTSVRNGKAIVIVSTGDPICTWAPGTAIYVGTLSMVFSGDIVGPIGDAVPDAASVVCSDVTFPPTSAPNGCDDESPGSKVALSDKNGDVGPLKIGDAGVAPPVTSEVDQIPTRGTPVAVGTHITYTARVSLAAKQLLPFMIQLKGDANIINRRLSCTSTTNGNATLASPNGLNPSCRWNGPVAAGDFTFIWSGDLIGSVGSAVPDGASRACTNTTSFNTCDEELEGAKIILSDATGDVGPVFVSGFRVYANGVASDSAEPFQPTATPTPRTATPSPSGTPGPSETPLPTTLPGPGGCTASASVDNPTPAQNSRVTLTGRLNCPNGRPADRIDMTSTWVFSDVTTRCTSPVLADGTATCTLPVGATLVGFTVVINMIFATPVLPDVPSLSFGAATATFTVK